MRVLFTTAPLCGHYFPLVPLAWACRSMGHEVLVATSDNFVSSATRSGLPAVSSGPGIELHLLADPAGTHGVADARYAHGQVFALMAARNLSGTSSIVDSWKPDLVVAERAELTGPIAAAARRIPHAQVCWGVPELAEYRSAAENGLRTRLRRTRLDRLPTPDMTLSPWPPSLRLPHASAHLGLRHVAYDGPARISSWMFEPGRRPRICLTLGTVLPHLAAAGLPGLVHEMLDSLAGMDVELIIAIDDELVGLLRPLPRAVRHAGRLPLSVALRTCAVLIHHGGQGTALTALAAGCPQVVLPTFDDQIENAEAVIGSGAGLSLSMHDATPRLVATYCQQVLTNGQFAESAGAVAQEISAQPSPTDVVVALERLALGEKPDHDESAAPPG